MPRHIEHLATKLVDNLTTIMGLSLFKNELNNIILWSREVSQGVIMLAMR
jgi:hypothetical protein